MTAKTLSEPKPPAGTGTRIQILSSGQLQSSPLLPELVQLINEAYAHAKRTRPGCDENGPRLNGIDDLLANVKDDPAAFTILITTGDGSLVATASARRYHGPKNLDGSSPVSPWMRTSKPLPGSEEWELKLMATSPRAQGQGLASFMMRLVEQEILKRTQESELDRAKLRMVLCTPLELTSDFYVRKGYTEDYRIARGDGRDWHIVFMSKDIECCSSSNTAYAPCTSCRAEYATRPIAVES